MNIFTIIFLVLTVVCFAEAVTSASKCKSWSEVFVLIVLVLVGGASLYLALTVDASAGTVP